MVDAQRAIAQLLAPRAFGADGVGQSGYAANIIMARGVGRAGARRAAALHIAEFRQVYLTDDSGFRSAVFVVGHDFGGGSQRRVGRCGFT